MRAVGPAMVVMGLASFASDLTMPISWDMCVEIGGAYTATVAAAMNMLGNLGGFVAPVVGGVIISAFTPELADGICLLTPWRARRRCQLRAGCIWIPSSAAENGSGCSAPGQRLSPDSVGL